MWESPCGTESNCPQAWLATESACGHPSSVQSGGAPAPGTCSSSDVNVLGLYENQKSLQSWGLPSRMSKRGYKLECKFHKDTDFSGFPLLCPQCLGQCP